MGGLYLSLLMRVCEVPNPACAEKSIVHAHVLTSVWDDSTVINGMAFLSHLPHPLFNSLWTQDSELPLWNGRVARTGVPEGSSWLARHPSGQCQVSETVARSPSGI